MWLIYLVGCSDSITCGEGTTLVDNQCEVIDDASTDTGNDSTETGPATYADLVVHRNVNLSDIDLSSLDEVGVRSVV